MDNKSDRRGFDRFPIKFVIEVVAQDSEGRRYKEKTVLKNISGGGAQFLTQQASKCFAGQLVEMTVFLTGTSMVKARMRGQATVVRIDLSSNSGIGEKTRGASIAVKFHTPLCFERADVKTQGNHGEPPRNL